MKRFGFLSSTRTVPLPFMIGYALRVKSLATAEMIVEAADLAWHSLDGGITSGLQEDHLSHATPAALKADLRERRGLSSDPTLDVGASVSHAMQSEFSACTITIAPSRRATASTEMICRSSSFSAS